MPQLTVHDVPADVYDLVLVDERYGAQFRWKELELPGIRIVLFPEGADLAGAGAADVPF